MNRYQQSQHERFTRGGHSRYRSPIEDEYMRRFMDDLMSREEMRRTREEMKAEIEEEERLERERLEKEYEQNKEKLKMMGKVIVEDVKGFAKAAWDIFMDLKGKK